MTESEVKKAFEEYKAQGWKDQDILSKLYFMYRDDKIDLDELRGMTKVLGYEFTEDFEKMTEDEKKKKGVREDVDEAREDVTKEEIEEAEEYGDDEDERKFEKKEKKEVKRDGRKEDEDFEEKFKEKKKGDDEEIERKEAFKMFGLDRK